MCSTYIMKNVPIYFQKGFWTLKWRESYLLSTWDRKISCQRFDWMLQSPSIRVKVKKCETNTPIYSHALLRIWTIGGQRSNHQHLHWEVLDHVAEDRSCWWRRPCTFRWHPQRSTSTEMEDWKSLVVGPLDEEAGREEQSSPTFDLHWRIFSVVHSCK